MSKTMAFHIGDNPLEQRSANYEKLLEGIKEDTDEEHISTLVEKLLEGIKEDIDEEHISTHVENDEELRSTLDKLEGMKEDTDDKEHISTHNVEIDEEHSSILNVEIDEEHSSILNVEIDEEHSSTLDKLEGEIRDLKELSPEACIFKVHEGLRRTNPEAYTPLMISIGPYHHGDPKLSKMEKLKVMYLKSFLKRKQGFSTRECWNKLKDWKGMAEGYYGDDIPLSGDKFVKMLLLDSCFAVEFIIRLYTFCKGQLNILDPLFMVRGMTYNVLRDMLLLENQLPLFVLKYLYDIVKPHGDPEFSVMVKFAFEDMLRMQFPTLFTEVADTNHDGIKHLLQFVHILCIPQNNLQIHEQDRDWKCFSCRNIDIESLEQKRDSTCFLSKFWKKPQESREDYDPNESRDIHTTTTHLQDIRTATELQDAGVHIKKVGKEIVNLFEINFNSHNGVLEIPSFCIDDKTEVFFRNLIAYEQHLGDVTNSLYFTDYAVLMDNLISTDKDANLLRVKGIILNCLGGDDKEVANLFNKLCVKVTYSYSQDFYYERVFEELNKHCNKPWNMLMAKLRRDYFNSSWAWISTVAAILLLSLAIAQTILSGIALRK